MCRDMAQAPAKGAGTSSCAPSRNLSLKSLCQEEMRLGIARQGLREALDPEAAISVMF